MRAKFIHNLAYSTLAVASCRPCVPRSKRLVLVLVLVPPFLSCERAPPRKPQPEPRALQKGIMEREVQGLLYEIYSAKNKLETTSASRKLRKILVDSSAVWPYRSLIMIPAVTLAQAGVQRQLHLVAHSGNVVR